LLVLLLCLDLRLAEVDRGALSLLMDSSLGFGGPPLLGLLVPNRNLDPHSVFAEEMRLV